MLFGGVAHRDSATWNAESGNRHLNSPTESNYARHHQYAALPDASEVVVQAGAQAIAWLPLGTYGDRAFVMIFAVLRPEACWSARQRELFEAAANVRGAARVGTVFPANGFTVSS